MINNNSSDSYSNSSISKNINNEAEIIRESENKSNNKLSSKLKSKSPNETISFMNTEEEIKVETKKKISLLWKKALDTLKEV